MSECVDVAATVRTYEVRLAFYRGEMTRVFNPYFALHSQGSVKCMQFLCPFATLR